MSQIKSNENKYIKDMIEGESLKLLKGFATPLLTLTSCQWRGSTKICFHILLQGHKELIGNFFQQAYNLADSIIITRYL